MAATIQIQFFGANGTTGANAEGGIKFNLDNTINNANNPIPRPTSTGTNYSFSKPLSMVVTVADAAITVSNRRIHISANLATGLYMYWRYDATWVAPAAPSASGSVGAVPSGYTLMTTTATAYNTTGNTATAGTNGNFVSLVLGVASTYDQAGAGQNVGLQNVVFTWDEA